jgi:hypothetical protein
MSWLSDRVIKHLYQDPSGEEIVLEFRADRDAPELYKLDGKTYKRVGMLPDKMAMTFKIQFERNGLIAYKYDSGDGKPRTVSATREMYEKRVNNIPAHKLREIHKQGRWSELSKSVTTKGYKEAFSKVQEKRGRK